MDIKKIPFYIHNSKKKLSIGVSAVIFSENNQQVLLVNKGEDRPLMSFPGGHLSNNETVFETAIREAEEEIAVRIKIKDPNPFAYLFNWGENFDILLIHYICEIVEGTPTPSNEIKNVFWKNINEVTTENSFANVVETLNHFKNRTV